MSKIILYNGDAYEAIKLIPDKSIDLIYVDIPYGFGSGGAGCFGSKHRAYHKEAEKCSINTQAIIKENINQVFTNDDENPILKSIKEKLKHKDTKLTSSKTSSKFGIDYTILDEFIRIMKKIYCYIWCSKDQIPELINYFVNERNCMYDILTWHKTNPIPACANKYLSDTEYCIMFREDGTKLVGNYKTKSKYYVSAINKKDKKLYDHPTIKPLEFVKNHIFNSTEENNVVLDCFMGSGTTGVACKELNRDFIGIEIDKKYFQIAKNRINEPVQLTIFDNEGEKNE